MSSPAPQVLSRPGTLPATRDRSIAFVANLLSLFFGNAEETRLLRDQVGKIETYGGRLLPILDLLFPGGDNLLVLEREPIPQLLEYFSGELKLALPQVACFPHGCYACLSGGTPAESTQFESLVSTLRDHPADWMDGFVSDRALEHLAGRAGKKRLNSYDASRDGNDKVKLQRFLESAGLPLFDSFYANSQTEAKRHMKILRQMGYEHAVIKSALGASGIGLERVPLTRSAEIPDYLFHSGTCLVQGWIAADDHRGRIIGSPSVQLYLDESTLQLYDLTDQILDESSIHQGNVSPPACASDNPQLHEDLLHQAHRVGVWLHSLGYRGTASVDFLAVESEDSITAYVCEINARVTGATYPSLLARRFLPRGAWQMRNVLLVPTQKATTVIGLLERHQLLFRKGTNSGILPVNFNHQHDGIVSKCQLLALADHTAATFELFKALQSIKEFAWSYDRD